MTSLQVEPFDREQNLIYWRIIFIYQGNHSYRTRLLKLVQKKPVRRLHIFPVQWQISNSHLGKRAFYFGGSILHFTKSMCKGMNKQEEKTQQCLQQKEDFFLDVCIVMPVYIPVNSQCIVYAFWDILVISNDIESTSFVCPG